MAALDRPASTQGGSRPRRAATPCLQRKSERAATSDNGTTHSSEGFLLSVSDCCFPAETVVTGTWMARPVPNAGRPWAGTTWPPSGTGQHVGGASVTWLSASSSPGLACRTAPRCTRRPARPAERHRRRRGDPFFLADQQSPFPTQPEKNAHQSLVPSRTNGWPARSVTSAITASRATITRISHARSRLVLRLR